MIKALVVGMSLSLAAGVAYAQGTDETGKPESCAPGTEQQHAAAAAALNQFTAGDITEEELEAELRDIFGEGCTGSLLGN